MYKKKGDGALENRRTYSVESCIYLAVRSVQVCLIALKGVHCLSRVMGACADLFWRYGQRVGLRACARGVGLFVCVCKETNIRLRKRQTGLLMPLDDFVESTMPLGFLLS